MSELSKAYPHKWRPSLGMIVVAMLVFVLALPIGSIWLFRFYDSLLVRETESELIMQGAFISAIMRKELTELRFNSDRLSQPMAPKNPKQSDLILPQIELATAPILRRREDAKPSLHRIAPIMQRVGSTLLPLLQDAQKTTLAGYRILDSEGTVIAGAAEGGQSLAHIKEVREALNGTYASVLRERRSDSPSPPIYSISRGTNIRVFVAMPIEYDGKVAGVAYLSRTPSHFLREMYGQIVQVIAALVLISLVTFAIGFLFVRTIKGPIEALNERTRRIANGDRSALKPLHRHGTREIASLSKGLLAMSEKLQSKNDYIRTFATHVSHELKSPLTSINGAAELLLDDGNDMEAQKRERFLNNIMQDTDRLSRLLDRLRELAATEQNIEAGETNIIECVANLRTQYPRLKITTDHADKLMIPMSPEPLQIVLSNLLENAANHHASNVHISLKSQNDKVLILIADDGSGISATNQKKVFEIFFTTRRENGGTGMGLSIVSSILTAHGGEIRILDSVEKGATFELTLPVVN